MLERLKRIGAVARCRDGHDGAAWPKLPADYHDGPRELRHDRLTVDRERPLMQMGHLM